MRKTSLGLVAGLALAVNGAAMAAGTYVGTITEVWAGDESTTSTGWIRLAGTISTPACASPVWFVMDLTDPVAKIHYAAALAALAAGKSVKLYGNGTCYSSSYERLRGVVVQQ